MSGLRSRPLFLAVRPPDRQTDTQAALAPFDLDLIFSDLMNYQPIDFELPDPALFDGLVVSSWRAIPSSAVWLSFFQHRPCYVVGQRTADCLRERGFTNLIAVAPTGARLIEQLRQSSFKRLLYLRGQDVAVDFMAVLAKDGGRIEPLITYQSVPSPVLKNDIINILTQQPVRAILLFSRVSARELVKTLKTSGLDHRVGTISALCLSPAVLECVHPLQWASTHVATCPDLEGMVAAVGMFLMQLSQDAD